MPLKSSKRRDWNSASQACSILLVIPEGSEDLSGNSFLIWVVSSSRVKGSMSGMGVWCGSGRLRLYRSVARENQCRFFLVIWGKFVFEEVCLSVAFLFVCVSLFLALVAN